MANRFSCLPFRILSYQCELNEDDVVPKWVVRTVQRRIVFSENVKTFVRIDHRWVSLVEGPEADFSDEVVRNLHRLANNKHIYAIVLTRLFQLTFCIFLRDFLHDKYCFKKKRSLSELFFEL